MKKALLLLLTLTALPALAADAPAPAPADAQPAAVTQPAPQTDGSTPDGAMAACPKTCIVMACPPPSGPSQLCCPVAPYTQTCP